MQLEGRLCFPSCPVAITGTSNFFFFTSSLGLEPARARWAQRMGRDPPPVLPGRLAAEEAPAEEAAEVWVRWVVLRLALLLMALSRVRKLSGLKLKGCASLEQMKFKASINWKVVHAMSKYFSLPACGVEWAAHMHKQWVAAWAQHDGRRGRP